MRATCVIGESRRKDDRLDAQPLARMDPQLLCPVKHRSAKAQADLIASRYLLLGKCDECTLMTRSDMPGRRNLDLQNLACFGRWLWVVGVLLASFAAAQERPPNRGTVTWRGIWMATA